jgi:hypothetical protein
MAKKRNQSRPKTRPSRARKKSPVNLPDYRDILDTLPPSGGDIPYVGLPSSGTSARSTRSGTTRRTRRKKHERSR